MRQALYGAGNEARTRYLHLGKVALYRMSYARVSRKDYTTICCLVKGLFSVFSVFRRLRLFRQFNDGVLRSLLRILDRFFLGRRQLRRLLRLDQPVLDLEKIPAQFPVAGRIGSYIPRQFSHMISSRSRKPPSRSPCTQTAGSI